MATVKLDKGFEDHLQTPQRSMITIDPMTSDGLLNGTLISVLNDEDLVARLDAHILPTVPQ